MGLALGKSYQPKPVLFSHSHTDAYTSFILLLLTHIYYIIAINQFQLQSFRLQENNI